MCFLNIKSFCYENSMIKIHPKPDRNSQKLPFCTALKAKIECPFIPPFGPQPPHTPRCQRRFEVVFDFLLIDHFTSHVVKFSTVHWLSFEWIFLQNCRFLENLYTTSKRLWRRCVKVRPRVWCKARREAKHRLFCSAPTQLCNYPDSSFLYTF